MSFMGLEIGRKGLSAHQAALETTGHNIANADNENYSRQRVVLDNADPLYIPALNRAGQKGMIGQGTTITSIERIRNQFIDDRILNTNQQKHYWQSKDRYLYQMEKIFNEPTDNTIRSRVDQFWASWEEVSKFPEDVSHREVLIEHSINLTARIKDSFQKLKHLRDETDEQIRTHSLEINSLAQTIADLNESITKSEAMGDNPNDLLDRRDKAFQRLSELVDTTVGRSDKDETMVFIGQQILVQGGKANKITVTPNDKNEGYNELIWEATGKTVLTRGGKMQALREIRDIQLKGAIDELDSLALNLMDIVNEVHMDGFGLNGKTNIPYFSALPLGDSVYGNFDLNNDGTNEISAVFRVSGKNKLELDRPIGLGGVMTFNHKNGVDQVGIQYTPDMTLRDVIGKINKSDAGISAYLNHDNQLALKSRMNENDSKTNFMIGHMEDNGNLLTGFAGILNASGPQGSFDINRVNDINKLQSSPENITLTPRFHPSSWLNVNEDIKSNPTLIAAAQGKDIGGTGDYNSPHGSKDGNNALLIAKAMKHRPSMVENSKTPLEHYNTMIAKLATEAHKSKDQFQTQELLLQDLKNQRQSISGVNLDEEMANIVKFQHGYNAAAKIISTMDQMLDTIINRMGR